MVLKWNDNPFNRLVWQLGEMGFVGDQKRCRLLNKALPTPLRPHHERDQKKSMFDSVGRADNDSERSFFRRNSEIAGEKKSRSDRHTDACATSPALIVFSEPVAKRWNSADVT